MTTTSELVIITSAICSDSFFTPEQRYTQTLETISSIKKYIPNALIYIVEITDIPSEYKQKLTEHTDKFIQCDKSSNINKNIGEVNILLTVLNYIPTYIKTIYKISGRYFLTDDFDINQFRKYADKYNFKLCSAGFCYHTTFYTIPILKIEQFIHVLRSCGIYDDVEHCFYNIPKEDVNIVDVLHCNGYFSYGLVYNG